MAIIQHTPPAAPVAPATPKFYAFRQNNSGGSFDTNDSVAQHVLIEARSAAEANGKALFIGIYFDGCADGTDCSCCGDRWNHTSEYDATETEVIDDEPVADVRPTFAKPGQPYCHVYHLDGSKTTYIAE